MKKNNIALVGFMASGKSAVSKELALALNKELISSDAKIVEREGMPITEIFESKGEEYFREVERKVIEEISLIDNVVIDCGGGVVLNTENIKCLQKSSVVIHLSVSPELVYARTKGKKDRPLLNVEDPVSKIKELLDFRRPFYEKADVTIDGNNKIIGEVCQEILELLKYD